MAEKLGKALGEDVRYNDVDPDVFRSFGFPGADEVGNMFQFKRDFEAQYAGARDRSFGVSLDPDLQDFDAWLAANASLIPLGERDGVELPFASPPCRRLRGHAARAFTVRWRAAA